jgi:hypothetical protein
MCASSEQVIYTSFKCLTSNISLVRSNTRVLEDLLADYKLDMFGRFKTNLIFGKVSFKNQYYPIASLDKLKYQIIEKKTSHKFIILTYAR